MQFLNRLQPLFLSFTLIACCLTFQSDTVLSTTTNNYSSWIANNLDQFQNQDVYKIKVRKTETILGNNFSIFSFKCFLNQQRSILAINYKKQNEQLLESPQQTDYLKIKLQTSISEDDTFIG